MHDGLNIDPEVLNQVLQNKLAQAAVREAQLEAAVQMLLNERQELFSKVQELEEGWQEEVSDDASADS